LKAQGGVTLNQARSAHHVRENEEKEWKNQNPDKNKSRPARMVLLKRAILKGPRENA
jgi:hypothetical protein